MPFFGTTSFAAPGLGIIASVIMLAGGLWWLGRRARVANAAGEGYGAHVERVPETDVVLREHAQQKGFDINELEPPRATAPVAGSEDLPPFALAVLPVLVVIVTNFVFVQFVVPRMDTSFLSEPLFGETTIEAVRGLWAVIVGLFLASVLLIVANWKRLTDVRASIDHGADASVLPIFNTASLVGFGAVIAALPVFGLISEAVMNISENPLIAVTGAVTILSAMTGSASGGMSIALEALGSTFVDLAHQTGVSLEAMHRVTAMASGTLDVMPHSGAVITLLAVCGLTHRDSYGDVFVVASIVPIVAMVVVLALVSFVGAF
jgi:H+/gluconate symporter-like permease